MEKTKCENCGAEVKDGVLMHEKWDCRNFPIHGVVEYGIVFPSTQSTHLSDEDPHTFPKLDRRSNYDSQVLKKEDGQICEHHPSQQKISASVKVMRSHDYCHFEVQLSNTDLDSLDEVDELRKSAARLVDKAVDQYMQHKDFLEWQMSMDGYSYRRLVAEVKKILLIAEPDRTPENKAKMKLLEDIQFHKNRSHDYQDDWDDNLPEIYRFSGEDIDEDDMPF